MSSSIAGRISLIPIIIAAVVGAGLGFGIGKFQGNQTADSLSQQLDEARADARHGQEAVQNVDLRVNQEVAYRKTALALIALNTGNSAEAKRLLADASQQLQGNSDTDLGKKTSALASAGTVTAPQIKSLLSSYEAMAPKPANLAAGRQ